MYQDILAVILENIKKYIAVKMYTFHQKKL